MSITGFINTDRNTEAIVEGIFSTQKEFSASPLTDIISAAEFLDSELPEIVIINFSDGDRNFILQAADKIRKESWLHNFGIIGVIDSSGEEDRVLKEFADLNILTLLHKRHLKTHLIRILNILEKEKQIIFQKALFDNLVENSTGTFLIENDIFAASLYAGILVTFLAQKGVVAPERKMFLKLVLTELIINSIEHGNCGVTYDEKSDFLGRGLNIIDLIEKKCEDPAIKARRVYLEWRISEYETLFVIKDEGTGFDVAGLKDKLKTKGKEALHGRGIKMAVELAREVRFSKKGNRITLLFDNDKDIINQTPQGFEQGEIIDCVKGQTVFREGAESGYLYYIVAGSYDVLVKGNIVGKIIPSDVFMGEMSFLLNNKRSATVVSRGHGKLVKITRKAYIQAIKNYPQYGLFLSRLLAQKLVRSNNLKVQGDS